MVSHHLICASVAVIAACNHNGMFGSDGGVDSGIDGGAEIDAAVVPSVCLADDHSFPAAAGAVNVRDHGAKGDGVTDDTAAFIAALRAANDPINTFANPWRDKIVYVPNGTYLVSDRISKAGMMVVNGIASWGSGLVLHGQSCTQTIIKLADHAPLFDDAARPRAVIFTASRLSDGSPGGGGNPSDPSFQASGGGNAAFNNYIEDLTIDTGVGNPGAIGIDYLANNFGAIRNVHITSGDAHGHIGIAAGVTGIRRIPGPALIEYVWIDGFDLGVDVGNTEYSLTMEHIDIEGARTAGLRNTDNSIAARQFTIHSVGPAIINRHSNAVGQHTGLIVMIDATLTHDGVATDGPAVANADYVNLRNVSATGFGHVVDLVSNSPIANGTPIEGIYSATARVSASAASWSAPNVVDPPATFVESTDRWVSVGGFPDQPAKDSSAAIVAAMTTGNPKTAYFPHGTYYVAHPIDVPDNIRRVVGMGSDIHVMGSALASSFGGGANASPANPASLGSVFRTHNVTKPLTIEHLAIAGVGGASVQGVYGIEHKGSQPLHIQDYPNNAISGGFLRRDAIAGSVFLDNFSATQLNLSGPTTNPIWARQLNSEYHNTHPLGSTRVYNHGAHLWVLGVKTEGNDTVVQTDGGGLSEIWGGLTYITFGPTGGAANPAVPAFSSDGSKTFLSFVDEAFDKTKAYTNELTNIVANVATNIPATMFPIRNGGRNVYRIAVPE